MATWNPQRNPERVPAKWHSLVQAEPGKYLLEVVGDEVERKRFFYRFNAWKGQLRAHPLHRTTQALAQRTVRLQAEPEGGRIYIWIVIAWANRLEELVKNIW